MNVERLIRLAELLEADAANPNGIKFALDTWGHDARLEDVSLMEYDDIIKLKYDPNTTTIPVDCNTAACAMGLAAISGVFSADGLNWRVLHMVEDGKGEFIPTMGDGIDGFAAAEHLFEIKPDVVSQLFDPSYYDQTKGAAAELAVADRIRCLVAGTWSPIIEVDDYDDDES